MTLAEHAEEWWSKKGNTVPPRNTAAWFEMYKQWVEWAFDDLHKDEPG